MSVLPVATRECVCNAAEYTKICISRVYNSVALLILFFCTFIQFLLRGPHITKTPDVSASDDTIYALTHIEFAQILINCTSHQNSNTGIWCSSNFDR